MSEEQLPNIRTVLIGMDGSKFSKYAFHFYLEYLRTPNDKIVIVHSVEPLQVYNSPIALTASYATSRAAISKMIEEEEDKTKKILEEFAKMLRENQMQGTVKSVYATKPGEGIIQMAKDLNASMIVVGSRGLGTFRRTFTGSVSDYVVHHSDVPVLVCPPKEH